MPRILLTEAEREVLMGVACRCAEQEGVLPPFRLRPGLVAEILDFYDTVHRHGRDVDTFERLALGMLEPGAADDRGAERLVVQTKFLARAFHHFERLREDTGSADEHILQRELIACAAPRPWRHVVVTVADRTSDIHGLFAADWDLLARLPGLERLDVLATDGTIAGAFHERIHQLLPGLEEVRPAEGVSHQPRMLIPISGDAVHIARDREEEIAAFARRVRVRRSSPGALDRTALVVRRPLPYVYLAREVLRSAGIPSQMYDALPLAAEPFAATLDAVVTCVTGNFTRGALIELLRSPHLRCGDAVRAHSLASLDRALSEAGYLGGHDALARIVDMWEVDSPTKPSADTRRAARVARTITAELAPLQEKAPCAVHLEQLLTFLTSSERVPGGDDPLRARLLRGRAAILDALVLLRNAYQRFDAAPVDFQVVAAIIRRLVEGRTFTPFTGTGGVHVVDAHSARVGDFEHVQLAGLVEGEWPDSPPRNIFYPPGLLRELGWGSETERVDAIRAAFADLLRLPSQELVVSAFTLEDDALVAPSPLLDTLAGAGLDSEKCVTPAARIFEYEALALKPVETSHLSPSARIAAARRLEDRTRRASGVTDAPDMAAYSVSALERYQDCPFKFFAADVLRLEEPVEDEPMRSPRARGRFLHEVFQRFFEAWDAAGHGTITVDLIDEARTVFERVVAPMLAELPEADAALERARLFGSAVSTGIAEIVLGLEASRPAAVRERWLEYRFEGEFTLGSSAGRRVSLKGVADRIDLLEGHRLRVIDYKSGSAPSPRRALQAAVYALCAKERLDARDGSTWAVDEAAYIALSGKRPLVAVVSAGASDASPALGSARDRLFQIVDSIEQGAFPPRPHEIRMCTYCAYPSVCRKDYVGDE
jgi:RecB family exonuclease